MILRLILTLIALSASLGLIYTTRKWSLAVGRLTQVLAQLRSVDLDAFRNLIDPEEEDFLRANLPPGDFRILQRERLHAAHDYIAGLTRNAAILLCMGQAARDEDPAVISADIHFITSALRLWWHWFLVNAMLHVKAIAPNIRLSARRVVNSSQWVGS